MPKIIEGIFCHRTDCFQNDKCLRCNLLIEEPDGVCPFFKTQAKVDMDRWAAHDKLIKKGRHDLIRKYEYNPYRKGQW